jgi:hypothetical protein
MRQPGEKVSREIGRVLATTLHEPRYYYASDALDLLDLHSVDSKEPFEAPDKFRTFLQRHVPRTMLDKTGKERREIDEVYAKGVLPSGKSHIRRRHVFAIMFEPPTGHRYHRGYSDR